MTVQTENAPSMTPYARHILICSGAYCDPDGLAKRLEHRLAMKLGDLGDYTNPVRVKRGMVSCLGVCIGGPIVVVYPEGIWYHHVDEEALDRIVDEHLMQNRPVEELIFHRLDENPALNEVADGRK